MRLLTAGKYRITQYRFSFRFSHTISSNHMNSRFDTAKGYGFIVPDDESGDVFVHQTSIKVEGFRSLEENARVEFRVEVDKTGKTKAMDVTPSG